MSLDLPDGAHGIRLGGPATGFATLSPLAFKESHEPHTTPNDAIADPALRHYDSDIKDEKASITSDVSPPSTTRYVNGEPVIENGEDVSNYVVDVRDDEDPALTFRSFVLGTIIAGLGAALAQA